MKEKIKELATKRKAIILAHWYTAPEIQAVADYCGDSLQLAKLAMQTEAEVIVFCGVNFMAETAKLLSPSKTIVTPDISATCSLADGCPSKELATWKQSFENPYLITYINSSASAKAVSDICCTSANVLKIIADAPKDKTLLFAPDYNLGQWAQSQTGRKIECWKGGCHVHNRFDLLDIKQLMQTYPKAEVLCHPECPPGVLALATFIGSTTAIMAYASQSAAGEFIVLTETGVLWQLTINHPNKQFYFAKTLINNELVPNTCADMKKHTLDKLLAALEALQPEVTIPNGLAKQALVPVLRMLEK